MHLEIVTQRGIVFNSNVEVGTFSGSDGSFQVLEHHANMISWLKIGIIEIKRKEDVVSFSIQGGVLEVCNNKATVLTDEAVLQK
ncbi:MAG: ATP synthase F1 subunit epsilon [Chitinophagaceae bacterium]|nr:ATP synthase F1 subunit epsilon [Chitinophagaceae bacterium]